MLVLNIINPEMIIEYKFQEKNIISVEENLPDLRISDYWDENDLSFIHIKNDNWSSTDLPWIQNRTGTWGDPHIIENVTINGGNTRWCIKIEDSNQFCIIRNCTLYNAGSGACYGALWLWNCNNCRIINNNCSDNSDIGIYLIESCNNTIEGNLANRNMDGIYLQQPCFKNIISENNMSDNINAGINLQLECCNNSILGNRLIRNNIGVLFNRNCNNNTIFNNIFNDNDEGIFFDGFAGNPCKNNTIKENNFYNQDSRGIRFRECNYNKILNNNISNNDMSGIFLSKSNNTIITRNIFENNPQDGIHLEECKDNLIYDNVFINNGVNAGDILGKSEWDNGKIGNYWSDYSGSDSNNDGIGDDNYTISSIVNDTRPLYEVPFFNGSKIHIDDTGVNALNWTQTKLVKWWCKGSGIWKDPYIIEYITINAREADYCIKIWNSDKIFIIRDCTFLNSSFGAYGGALRLYNVNNSMLVNNNCSYNTEIGIDVSSCSNLTIIDNFMTKNQFGIYLQGGHNNTIKNNIIEDLTNKGIYIYSSENNTISENIIKECNNDGIYIENAFEDSRNNLVYNNSFYQNANHAYDEGINTKWNNTIIGNYWDNYTELGIGAVDKNDDGIGDIPYPISGSANSKDFKPIWEDGSDFPRIKIISPKNNTYCSKAPIINITVYDDDLDFIWYNISGNPTKEFLKNNTAEFLNDTLWSNLPEGMFQISFYANDSHGNLNDTYTFMLYKDTYSPHITINSPSFNEIFGIEAPNFNISINDPNFNSIWYTIDNGLTNITFSTLTGTIDQGEWDKKGIGSVFLTFYTNDTVGNLGFQTVSIEKFYEYWTLDPMIIDESGKSNFTWAQAVMKGWCYGSGISSDPYIIEYIKINGYNSRSCIEIWNSGVYFTIRNCVFYNSSDGIFDAGIKLDHVSNGTLINNNCSSNNGNGIVLESCHNIVIEESSVNYNGLNGIFLINSFNNSINDNKNTINNNGNHGINLLLSSNNTITMNTINYNSIGIFLSESNYNIITKSDLRYNGKAYEEVNCLGNEFNNNILDGLPGEGFPNEIIIVIISIIGIIIIAITGAIIWKKKISITEEEKEEKKEKKRIKTKHKLQKRIIDIDDLIKENNFEIALKNLIELKEKAQGYDLKDFLLNIEEKINYCKKLVLESINSLKNIIIHLGKKFMRLQLAEIIEKSIIKDEDLIEDVIQKMIDNKEIIAEYFSSTKSVVFEQEPVLISELGEIKQFDVFLSYSTKDSEYFQLSKVVKRLELYPEIGNVVYWEADSGENIVEYMERNLKRCNVFVLFCSENSLNSKAVTDEWQAAFQLRKQGQLKIVPVYENERFIPALLTPLLNVKYSGEELIDFISELYNEILRE